ncbi:MAG: electron transfer flavoprotein subunit beta/FixA family protein [Desulfobacterales bacterium]|nr:electron transfer flavoprotein subunit beta/FixA family protein [Desulfobacterales bacterium]
MKILTSVKKVVDVELNIHVDNGAIKEEGLQYVMNAWDENAVEAAVQLKESSGAETTLVHIGSGDDNTKIIRKAFAMGMDNAIQVDDAAITGGDSYVYAKILQAVAAQGAYDLIITGKQAQDTDAGQTGIILAELMDIPCVSNVIQMEVKDEAHITVSRLGDSGTEILDLELPAVVTVSDSINEPRLPAMRAIMMAKKKKIQSMDLGALDTSFDGVGGQALTSEVSEFMPVEGRTAGQKFEGDAADVTAQVVGLLANEAKVF